MKKTLVVMVSLVLCVAFVTTGCAEGLFGAIGSLFGNEKKEEQHSVLDDLGTIAGGLFAEENDLPKEIHYGDYEQFKKEIDTLEAYFEEYAAFMKKYDASDISMLADYTSLMAKYTEAMRVLDALDESKMNSQEKKYYQQVLLRINQILYSAL